LPGLGSWREQHREEFRALRCRKIRRANSLSVLVRVFVHRNTRRTGSTKLNPQAV
jgi:hypothetical protein